MKYLKFILLGLLLVPFSTSAQISDQLATQKFSAGPITNINAPTDCQVKGTGQIMVISNLDLKNTTVNLALTNNQAWTKRGKLYPVDSTTQGKLKVSAELKDKTVLSGAIFPDVPVGQKITAYSTSDAWTKDGKTKAVVQEISVLVSKACDTKYFFVDLVSTDLNKIQTDQYAVCVHNQSSANEYGPKQTFTIGKDDSAIAEYQKNHSGSVVSLGPCQNDLKTSSGTAATGASTGSGLSITSADPSQLKGGGTVGASTGSSGTSSTSSTGATLDYDALVKGCPTSYPGVTYSCLNDGPCGKVTGMDSDSLGDTEWRQRALVEMNKMRSEKGVTTMYTMDETLNKYAEARLKYLIDNNLLGPTGNLPPGDGGHLGASCMASNARSIGVLRGGSDSEIKIDGMSPTDPESVIEYYKTSPPHYYLGILSSTITKVGIAIKISGGRAFNLIAMQ